MAQDPALNDLFECPQRFEFAQAIRVLLRNSPWTQNGELGGRRFNRLEPVRVEAHQSLAFPTADIQSLDRPDETGRAHMRVNFLGLTGPAGVLPLVYTQELLDRAKGDSAAQDFFDIFNHRMSMLFYYAWEKYRFAVQYEGQPEQDVFRWILLALVGLASEHLQNRQALPDDFFIKYAALLAMQPRSASALQTILGDYFNVPVEVDQFAGAWFHLDDSTSTRFRDEESGSERLGFGVVAGREYWSHESAVRLRIGPVNMETYRRFLPDGPWFRQAAAICRFFSRDDLVFELQLVLERSAVPRIELRSRPRQGEPEERSSLGWTTWARSARSAVRDADDVTFRL